MSNYSEGHAAEKQAADYLQSHDFDICELNWKTRFCEIDVIAIKNGKVIFFEVKSRHNSNQGFGMDYVTPSKLRQMRFAAEMWVHEHSWSGDYELGVVSIDGSEITVIDSLDV